jgi:hypothetical protein
MHFLGSKSKRTILPVALFFSICFGNMAFAQVPEASPALTPLPDSPSVKTAQTDAKPVEKRRRGGVKYNFHEFTRQTFSPWTFILPAATAGISTAMSDDHAFEPGAMGYGQRYGAYLADNVEAKFFRAFAFPTVFNQVERYDRVGSGNGFGKRFGHAFAHTFVTRTRDGNRTFNMSGIPASFAVGAMGKLYYPGNYGDNWHMAQRAAWMQAGYFGQDLWREFRPEICHAIHIRCDRHKIIAP